MRIFENKKTGKAYRLLHIAMNATNGNEGTAMAVYANIKGIPFVREMAEFEVKFTEYPADHPEVKNFKDADWCSICRGPRQCI